MKRYKITPESIFTYYQTLSEEFLKKQLPGSEEFEGHGSNLHWAYTNMQISPTRDVILETKGYLDGQMQDENWVLCFGHDEPSI